MTTIKESIMEDKDIGQLILILRNVEGHYNDPYIADNGKAEGLCLAVRGIKGIIKKYKEINKWDEYMNRVDNIEANIKCELTFRDIAIMDKTKNKGYSDDFRLGYSCAIRNILLDLEGWL